MELKNNFLMFRLNYFSKETDKGGKKLFTKKQQQQKKKPRDS